MKDLVRCYRIIKYFILFLGTGYGDYLIEIEHLYNMKRFSSNDFVRFWTNRLFERLHRYVFDYCYQSNNVFWGYKTAYFKANRDNPLKKYNRLIEGFYSIVGPCFKGWRKQLKAHRPKVYERYETI